MSKHKHAVKHAVLGATLLVLLGTVGTSLAQYGGSMMGPPPMPPMQGGFGPGPMMGPPPFEMGGGMGGFGGEEMMGPPPGMGMGGRGSAGPMMGPPPGMGMGGPMGGQNPFKMACKGVNKNNVPMIANNLQNLADNFDLSFSSDAYDVSDEDDGEDAREALQDQMEALAEEMQEYQMKARELQEDIRAAADDEDEELFNELQAELKAFRKESKAKEKEFRKQMKVLNKQMRDLEKNKNNRWSTLVIPLKNACADLKNQWESKNKAEQAEFKRDEEEARQAQREDKKNWQLQNNYQAPTFPREFQPELTVPVQ